VTCSSAGGAGANSKLFDVVLAFAVARLLPHVLSNAVDPGSVPTKMGGPGRPRRRYCITPAGEALWPKRYGQLTNQLLDFVRQEKPELVDKVFTRRGEARGERAAERLSGLGFDARIEELTRILDEDGYLAQCRREADESWLVVEHNCAILDVARRYGAACSSELAFLRAAMPDASVDRIKHKMAGDFLCAYRIAARAGITPRK